MPKQTVETGSNFADFVGKSMVVYEVCVHRTNGQVYLLTPSTPLHCCACAQDKRTGVLTDTKHPIQCCVNAQDKRTGVLTDTKHPTPLQPQQTEEEEQNGRDGKSHDWL